MISTVERTDKVDGVEPAVLAGVSAVDARRGPRYPMTVAVRVGWINDEKRMSYLTAEGVDISEGGLAVHMGHRLRLSALVHLELAGSGMCAVARVRNCVWMGGAWRVGLEVTSAFPGERGEASGVFEPVEPAA
jgi:hypothetical protein